MTTTIYFVRHGEVYNPKDTVYGRIPGFKLSPLGREQLKKTGDFLSSFAIDQVFSSNQDRARESAQIIGEKTAHKKIHISPDLQEIQSPYEGAIFSDIKGVDVYTKAYNGVRGESMESVLKRIKRFISRTSKKYEGQRIVAVSHGDPIMTLRTHIDKLPLIFKSIRPGDGTYIKHGEVYEVNYDDLVENLTYKSIYIPQV